MQERGILMCCVMAVGVACPVHSAFAGGLYIQEFATPSMGTADAGSQAWADNSSTAWHNPAGMTRLERSEVGAGIGIMRNSTIVAAGPDAFRPRTLSWRLPASGGLS